MTDPLHVTSSSRVMLPAYVGGAAWIGVVYVFDPLDRVQRAAGLELARLLLPMWAWGLMFLILAVTIGAAWATGREVAIRAALLTCGVVLVFWAVIYAGAVALNDRASLVGPVWPLVAACACKASERSIRNRGA